MGKIERRKYRGAIRASHKTTTSSSQISGKLAWMAQMRGDSYVIETTSAQPIRRIAAVSRPSETRICSAYPKLAALRGDASRAVTPGEKSRPQCALELANAHRKGGLRGVKVRRCRGELLSLPAQ
jgi:hypothetical protein